MFTTTAALAGGVQALAPAPAAAFNTEDDECTYLVLLEDCGESVGDGLPSEDQADDDSQEEDQDQPWEEADRLEEEEMELGILATHCTSLSVEAWQADATFQASQYADAIAGVDGPSQGTSDASARAEAARADLGACQTQLEQETTRLADFTAKLGLPPQPAYLKPMDVPMFEEGPRPRGKQRRGKRKLNRVGRR